MPAHDPLKPASELARNNPVRFPNESAEYRRAREALLAEEIELRRHIERVAEQRRALPPGGEVAKDYRFEGERGPVGFADLFGDKQTLVVYSYMFGPQRERPCPMCTSLLSAWDGEARDVEQRVALAVVARSPIERLVAFKKERGWRNLRLYSDTTRRVQPRLSRGERRRRGRCRPSTCSRAATERFATSGAARWASSTADPGQDPRGAPDLMPIWTILDATPEGRGTDWYPKLEYDR